MSQKSASLIIAGEVSALRQQWRTLQQDAATFGVKLLNFAVTYSRIYAKVRHGKDEEVADDAVKSLNAAIGIDDSKATMFRRIAERADVLKRNRARLPSSIDAMYQIAQIPEARANKLFDKGTINPGLTVREARVLKSSSANKPRRSVPRQSAEVRSLRLQWSSRDHAEVLSALRYLLTRCDSALLQSTDHKLRDDLAGAFGPALSVRIAK